MADRYASLKQDLVGCWIPSISGSGLLLPDLSGRGNNGSLVNMDASDWVSSGSGRALDFDGTNDFTDFAFSQAHNSDYVTATAWVLVTGSGTRRIVTKPRQAGLAQSYSLVILSSGFATWIANTATLDGAGSLVSGSVNLTNAGWTHLAGTWDGTTSRLFVNGTQVNAVTGSGVITYSPTSNLPLQIGRFDATVGQYHSGQLDDIRLYSRALTESEIKLLASKRGIGLEPRKPKITFTDLGVQKTYSVVRVKETDYATLRQGLVGAWCPSLPNGGSGNTLPDVSGYGNHGSLVNMSPDDWVSSQYGRALDFDGSNDYVSCGTSNNSLLVQSKAFSISAWIYLTSTTSDRTILTNAKITPNYDGMNFLSAAGKLRFDLGGDSSPTFPLKRKETTNAVFSTGMWYHVAVTKPASAATSAISLYVNGVQPATIDAFNDTVADAVNNVNLQIAARDGANSLLQGQIDDVRIYNRVLTEPEIRLLASRPGIGLRQESHRNTFYQFPSFQPAITRRSSAIIGGGIT